MMDLRVPSVGLLAAALLAAMLLSLCIGAYPISPTSVAHILLTLLSGGSHTDIPATAFTVVAVVRLPRVAMATIAGIGLGLSGASLQGVFRNPLVGPDIVGVSSGAALGGVLAISLSWGPFATTALAMTGGIGALAIAASLARATRAGLLGIVLAGILVSAFASALIGIAELLADPSSTLPNIVFWLMGSFADANRARVLALGSATLAGGLGLLLLRWRINLLSLGDEDAGALGVRVEPLRWSILALVALLVAAQVAVSGIIGWVGLVVPHISRTIVGPDHSRLLPATGIVGGLFVLIVDDIARSVSDQELPIGLLTALIGAPFFAVVLRRTSRAGWRER